MKPPVQSHNHLPKNAVYKNKWSIIPLTLYSRYSNRKCTLNQPVSFHISPHNKWYLNTSRPMLFLRKHTVLDIYHSTPIMTQRLYHISPKILEPLLNQARPPLLARNIHPQNCGTFLESSSHCFPSLTTLLCYPSCPYFPKCRGLNSKVLP